MESWYYKEPITIILYDQNMLPVIKIKIQIKLTQLWGASNDPKYPKTTWGQNLDEQFVKNPI
jgi:hypothetical protein